MAAHAAHSLGLPMRDGPGYGSGLGRVATHPFRAKAGLSACADQRPASQQQTASTRPAQSHGVQPAERLQSAARYELFVEPVVDE